jgi:CheY-like chemotaxis protein
MYSQDIQILLVEDDEVDAEAIRRALQQRGLPNPLTIVPDGIEALNVLRGKSGQSPLPRPYLILLDINLPRMTGLEFLRILRQDPELRRSIVFVLTTSNRAQDKMAAYNEQVAGYLVKSKVNSDFNKVITLLDYYGQFVEFPPEMTS